MDSILAGLDVRRRVSVADVLRPRRAVVVSPAEVALRLEVERLKADRRVLRIVVWAQMWLAVGSAVYTWGVLR